MGEAGTRLVIVLWSAASGPPSFVAAPFVYALAARALEIEVEMHYTASSVRWLLPGVAEGVFTDGGRTKTLADYIRETRAAGVRHIACAMALAEHVPGDRSLLAADDIAGAATVVAAAAEPGTRIMVF